MQRPHVDQSHAHIYLFNRALLHDIHSPISFGRRDSGRIGVLHGPGSNPSFSDSLLPVRKLIWIPGDISPRTNPIGVGFCILNLGD